MGRVMTLGAVGVVLVALGFMLFGRNLLAMLVEAGIAVAQFLLAFLPLPH